MKKPIAAMSTTLLLAMLVGCSSPDGEAATPANVADTAAPAPRADPTVASEPTRSDAEVEEGSTVADTNATAAAPDEPVAPDAQMMDDATATGMTARVSRGDSPPDEAAPVEQVERK